MTHPPDLDAIILAGGRASRLGGAAKPLLEVHGRTLLAHTVDAVQDAGARRIIVASEPLGEDPRVTWVREDPPFGGPVSGVIAGLPHVTAEWCLVLACDMPRIGDALRGLLSAAWGRDGACLVGAEGRPHHLTAVYRTASLRTAGAQLPRAGADAAVHALTAALSIARVPDPSSAAADVDTWEDLERARRRPPEEDSTVSSPSRTLPPEALDAWAAALRERFGLGEDDLPVALILDLARDVANGVARPAAPFSAFAAGLVAGREGGTPAQVREAVATVVELAENWNPSTGAQG